MPELSSPLAWRPIAGGPAFSPEVLAEAIGRVREPLAVVRDDDGRLGLGLGGEIVSNEGERWPLVASLPPLYPEWLGDRSFCEVHQVRFPYIAGEMANGIATARLVIAMAHAEMLGFFGAAGLSPERVARNVAEIQAAVGSRSWGANLIHAPHEPAVEAAVADLFLSMGVRRVCASAYLDLTLPVVKYAVTGLRETPDGRITRDNHLFAKVSRPEVGVKFLAPAPPDMLAALVARGEITASEASLARHVALAEDLTVEADSGGHTDNQAMPALLPTMLALRDQMAASYGYSRPIRVGAAGGLGTPGALAAAFAMGADYVLTGSVNQACIEAGLSEAGRVMLAGASLGDTAMAPAADMFELGVKLQVLRRGTLFPQRAQRLYDLYLGYESIEAIPAAERARLEREIFRVSLDQVWEDTRVFFASRNPEELERAEADPKRKMALVFRWYLGLSSRWAIDGIPERRMDYQIWCGPAMAAFNTWVKGSFLEDPHQREVVQVALNLLEGAAVWTRAQQLRAVGVAVPASAFHFRPRPFAVDSFADSGPASPGGAP